MKQKLVTIDFLRVIFAISIMLYHYKSWSNSEVGIILEILSIYTVEGFFVISGIVLIYNYYYNYEWKKYFIHRFFRIVPLFYLAVLLELLRHYNSQYFGYADYETFIFKLISNLSFFNILQPYKASVVSSWSIMVEGGFYIMFPILLLLFRNYNIKIIYFFIFLATFSIYILFNFFLFNGNSMQNNLYTNVFFHLHFFLFGMLIGYIKLMEKKRFNFFKTIFLIFCLSYFIDIQNYIDLILNTNRIILSMITIVIIAYFTFNDILLKIPKELQTIVKILSNLTYSIYLLHFFIFYIFYNVLGYKNIYIMMLITISISIPFYYLYEKRFILLGKKYA